MVGTLLFSNRKIPVSFFVKGLSVGVNNKMSTYQASVEFEFNQESSDFDLSLTVAAPDSQLCS